MSDAPERSISQAALKQQIATTAQARHDPGGSRSFPLAVGVVGDAIFSPCQRYRHALMREWPVLLASKARPALFIGMNPSTADAMRDDPTCKREQGFARRENCTQYIKVNVMDYRATYPLDLRELGVVPRSDTNLSWIRRFAQHTRDLNGFAVAAWGVIHADLKHYTDEALAVLRATGVELLCLGVSLSGAPRHPLYQPADAKLVPFLGGVQS